MRAGGPIPVCDFMTRLLGAMALYSHFLINFGEESEKGW